MVTLVLIFHLELGNIWRELFQQRCSIAGLECFQPTRPMLGFRKAIEPLQQDSYILMGAIPESFRIHLKGFRQYHHALGSGAPHLILIVLLRASEIPFGEGIPRIAVTIFGTSKSQLVHLPGIIRWQTSGDSFTPDEIGMRMLLHKGGHGPVFTGNG